MEYYSVTKRSTFESVLVRWMNLEPVLQSEISQKERDKYCIVTYICTESRKMVLKNVFTGQQWRNRHREQTSEHGEREEECEMYGKSNMETYITTRKIDSQREFAVCLRKLKPGLCINLGGGTEREVGWRFKREGIYVYLWLIHVEVYRKQQNCGKQLSINKR